MDSNHFPQFDPVYKAASHHLKRVIIEELRNGHYFHLANPNNRSLREPSIDNLRLRFRMMCRPPDQKIEGQRHLEIGSSEVLLFLHGDFIRGDYRKGMDLSSPYSKYRFVYSDIVGYGFFAKEVNDAFRQFLNHGGRELLETGNYVPFVNTTLHLMDERVTALKGILDVKTLL